jgi:hypothetical protein
MLIYKRVAISDKEFENALPGSIFAHGEIQNHSQGLYMTHNHINRMLLWVAVKGYKGDWSMYCHWADENTVESVKLNGDKVISDYHIRRVLEISNAVFEKYRY